MPGFMPPHSCGYLQWGGASKALFFAAVCCFLASGNTHAQGIQFDKAFCVLLIVGAAVIFKRTDRHSGAVRYLYHGNDGTSMPWNDTAQLNYLKAEVREAVIETIKHVARMFPIIRFDAAMTLAKKHVARLWYPERGQGGAIPSRAESAMRPPI